MSKKQKKKVRASPIKKQINVNDAFTNYPARMGYGQANLLEGTEYSSVRMTSNWQELISLYRTHWIVRRIIDTFPEDMTKSWYKVTSAITPDEQAQIIRLERRTHLREKILEGLRWGRLFGGALGIMMIDGEEDRLNEPINYDYIMPDSFRGLMIVDRWSGVNPGINNVDDINDPEFGLPEYYDISFEKTNERVHHSRVVRFTGRDLPRYEKVAEQYWGASEMEHVIDELEKRDNASWNTAQLLFRANIMSYRMESLSQMLVSTDTRAQNNFYNTMQAISNMMSNSGLVILDKEDGLESHQYSFGGVSDVLDQFMCDIAGAAEMPVTKLFGRSPAGLNATGESDMQNYYDSVEEKQEMHVRPVIEKLLPILFLSEFGKVPDDLEFEFNPCRRITDTERADFVSKMTTAIQGIHDSGITTQRQTLRELSNMAENYGVWGSITDVDINNADNEYMPVSEELPNLETLGLGSMGNNEG